MDEYDWAPERIADSSLRFQVGVPDPSEHSARLARGRKKCFWLRKLHRCNFNEDAFHEIFAWIVRGRGHSPSCKWGRKCIQAEQGQCEACRSTSRLHISLARALSFSDRLFAWLLSRMLGHQNLLKDSSSARRSRFYSECNIFGCSYWQARQTQNERQDSRSLQSSCSRRGQKRVYEEGLHSRTALRALWKRLSDGSMVSFRELIL